MVFILNREFGFWLSRRIVIVWRERLENNFSVIELSSICTLTEHFKPSNRILARLISRLHEKMSVGREWRQTRKDIFSWLWASWGQLALPRAGVIGSCQEPGLLIWRETLLCTGMNLTPRKAWLSDKAQAAQGQSKHCYVLHRWVMSPVWASISSCEIEDPNHWQSYSLDGIMNGKNTGPHSLGIMLCIISFFNSMSLNYFSCLLFFWNIFFIISIFYL